MVQEKLKEKNINSKSFIGGWFISKDICDELIEYFKYNKKYSHLGTIGTPDGMQENKEKKESIDLRVGPQNHDNIIGVYREKLQDVLNSYLEKYNFANRVVPFDIIENIGIQYYPVGGGYKVWHTENNGHPNNLLRHLVFMTYLNDVEDGGTEFYYQGIKTKAEKGLTLLWPATWTHFHRGIISSTKEKYIITGWYSFL